MIWNKFHNLTTTEYNMPVFFINIIEWNNLNISQIIHI